MSETSKLETLEKGWEILNEYYPGWEGYGRSKRKTEAWAKVLTEDTVEIFAITRMYEWITPKIHRNVWIRYVVDIKELGLILEEENVKGDDWTRDTYTKIR
ncbi:MAG: hypothetical protein QNK23_18085 [Crocinitomicaceae bacterium]|nr:hypothetical protein [Crocinitomicaceae bacterium]